MGIMETFVPFQDAWTLARNRYVEDFTEAERQIYYQATLENIFYDASAAEKTLQAKSLSRSCMTNLRPLLNAIEQYVQALDVYANAYPLVMCPLWGSNTSPHSCESGFILLLYLQPLTFDRLRKNSKSTLENL